MMVIEPRPTTVTWIVLLGLTTQFGQVEPHHDLVPGGAMGQFFYDQTRKNPEKVKDRLLGMTREALGDEMVDEQSTARAVLEALGAGAYLANSIVNRSGSAVIRSHAIRSANATCSEPAFCC